MSTIVKSKAAAIPADSVIPKIEVMISSGPERNAASFTGAESQSRTVKGLPRLRRVFGEELQGFHVRLLLVQLCMCLLPKQMGGRLRVLALKLIGFKIGHGTIMAGMPVLTGGKNIYKNLVIGEGCWINFGCCFDIGAPIKIGSEVSIGHQVLLLTHSHSIGLPQRRASTLSAQPVTIENGAWLGARCTILPGVTVGAGAVVAAGSVVHKNVPPNMLVAGVPARVVKTLN